MLITINELSNRVIRGELGREYGIIRDIFLDNDYSKRELTLFLSNISPYISIDGNKEVGINIFESILQTQDITDIDFYEFIKDLYYLHVGEDGFLVTSVCECNFRSPNQEGILRRLKDYFKDEFIPRKGINVWVNMSEKFGTDRTVQVCALDIVLLRRDIKARLDRFEPIRVSNYKNIFIPFNSIVNVDFLRSISGSSKIILGVNITYAIDRGIIKSRSLNIWRSLN